MIKQVILASAALACELLPLCAAAQVGPSTPQQPVAAIAVEQASTPAMTTAAACVGCFTIPALTPVRLEFLATLGSKTSKSGDVFPIRLAAAIVVDGKTAIPAGTTGMGEVIHAKKSGGSGAAGELVLAARYLDVGGQRLRLRSLHVSPNGKSNIDTVNTINVASAAVAPVLSVVGFFITGGQATVQQGSVADARTAEAFTLASPAPEPLSTPQPPVPGAQHASQEEGK